MKASRLAALAGLVCASVLCGGCAGVFGNLAFWRDRPNSAPAPTYRSAEPAPYGVEADVQETVHLVKTAGKMTVMSSHAIRLPSRPLTSITAFDYALPGACGGHQFRVYESDGTQILEYAYSPSAGEHHVIRDYISGPSPFIRAGLWSAYDHTAGSVADMSMHFERRGYGLFKGTYSQGPVTGLDPSAQRTLGLAYDRALRDVYGCRG